ncbi:MAG TPA: hypothetical protein VGH77_12635 [Streptosporangiaceae bacterium]|jgi:hypothetical protein
MLIIGTQPTGDAVDASWKSWHRWTAICLLAYIYLAVAVALQRQQEASSSPDTGLIPVTIPELLRLLRGTVIPPPGETGPPAALVGLAPPPPVPRPPSPPTMERLRGSNTMITTVYSCRNCECS